MGNQNNPYDTKNEILRYSRPVVDGSKDLAREAMWSGIKTVSPFNAMNEVKKFNNDIDTAYDFFKTKYESELHRYNSNLRQLKECNSAIVKDEADLHDLSLLNQKDSFVQKRSSELKTNLDYNRHRLSILEKKSDVLRGNTKKYRKVTNELSELRKMRIKNKISDSKKMATAKKMAQNSLKIAKETANQTLKATVQAGKTLTKEGIDASEQAGYIATDVGAKGVEAGASAIPYVGAAIAESVEESHKTAQTAYKISSKSAKALVHAADKTAMSASKALKSSVKFTKLQQKILSADNPQEMAKNIAETGIKGVIALITYTAKTIVNRVLKFFGQLFGALMTVLAIVCLPVAIVILILMIIFGAYYAYQISVAKNETIAAINLSNANTSTSTASGAYLSLNAVYVYQYLKEKTGNKEAACAIMGTIANEGGFRSNNVEDAFEDGGYLTTKHTFLGTYSSANDNTYDQGYTDALNDGRITKEEFFDSGNLDANSQGLLGWGYGLIQFTGAGNKEGLWNYATTWCSSHNKTFDISDLQMQCEYLIDGYYKDRSYNGRTVSDYLCDSSVDGDMKIKLCVWANWGTGHNFNSVTSYTGYSARYTAYQTYLSGADCYENGSFSTGITSPRLEELGTQLTMAIAQAEDSYFGNSSPGGSTYSIVGHGGNCVSYVYGRRQELESGVSQLGFWDASTYWNNAVSQGVYQTGQVPKVGAVVCWDGNGTSQKHVAIIEQILYNADGSINMIYTGNSSWSHKWVWYEGRYSSEAALRNSEKGFNGYVYLEKN